MPRSIRFRLSVLIFPLSFLLFGQQQQPVKLQTARQALLEMLTGNDQAMSKHLTIEVQQSLKQSNSKSGDMALGTVAGFRSLGLDKSNQETFDTGSVLLALSDPRTHERVEVHVDSDDLAGDEDTMQLSLHAFRDGQEIDTAVQIISQIEVAMVKQQNIWRLNAITVSARLPVGDPKLMEKLTSSMRGGMFGGKIGVAPHDQNQTSEPPPDMEQTVQMLAFAEGFHATTHPESGFTCSLTELLSKDNPMLQAWRLDPKMVSGSFNGYKLAVSGCQGTPAGSFQIVAEPIAPGSGSKAFCTDATHNIRTADDGRGSTCLSSGKFENRATGNHVGVHTTLKSK